MSWFSRPATAGDLREMEARILKAMENAQNAQQAQIDNVIKELQGAKATLDKTAANVATIKTGIDGLKASQTALQKAFDDFKAANPTVDLSGLQTAADAVAGDVSTVDSAVSDAEADLGLDLPPAPAGQTSGQ